jgi:hypothetical protein
MCKVYGVGVLTTNLFCFSSSLTGIYQNGRLWFLSAAYHVRILRGLWELIECTAMIVCPQMRYHLSA